MLLTLGGVVTLVHFASVWSQYEVVFWRPAYCLSYTNGRLWYSTPRAGEVITRELIDGQLWSCGWPASMEARLPPEQLSGFALAYYGSWSNWSGFARGYLPTFKTGPLVVCFPTVSLVVVAWGGFGVVVWLDRRARRRLAGVCRVCRYSREGLAAEAMCPECGACG